MCLKAFNVRRLAFHVRRSWGAASMERRREVSDWLSLSLMSRRDDPIVAWHEVPGKASYDRTVPLGHFATGFSYALGSRVSLTTDN
jgi:hypothetical protein